MSVPSFPVLPLLNICIQIALSLATTAIKGTCNELMTSFWVTCCAHYTMARRGGVCLRLINMILRFCAEATIIAFSACNIMLVCLTSH